MKLLISCVAFLGTFFVYHLIGCQIFPIDENNILQAPDSYAILGAALSIVVACFFVKVWNKHSHLQKKPNSNKRTKLNTIIKKPRYHVPYNITYEEHAISLVEDTQYCARTINTTSDIFEFSCSFRQLVDTLKELIWLYNRKGIKLTADPQEDLDRLRKNVALTVDDFISRAMRNISEHDPKRADKLENLVEDIETDEIFQKIMKSSNLSRLQGIREEAKNIRDTDILNRLGREPSLDCSSIDPMDVIVTMESYLDSLYQSYLRNGWSSEYGAKLLNEFIHSCETSTLPLAAEVRLESLLSDYQPKFSEQNVFNLIDSMEGHDFEVWCSGILRRNGFINVEVTPSSGDHGVDVLAEKDGIHYAIQCKCYSNDLGNTPVQEVYSGKEMYRCQVGVVMTNRYFTNGAKQLAEKTRVLLWDRDKLKSLIDSAE